ncbi:MAG TPA: hypothetical protein VMU00_09515 [Steroidobacteraceae bacterium]|nr:hypothetical protein [Steroidobacteraceae bacterium]
MSRPRLALLALGGAAALALALWWQLEPAPPAPAAAPPAVAPRAAAYDRPTAAAPAAPAAAAPSLSARLLRATLVAHLRAAPLPRELAELIAAGDGAEVVRRLAAAREPGSAALLAELQALCRRVGDPADDAAAAEARSQLRAAARDAAAGQALEALIVARREAGRQLAASCGAARFDPAAIQRQLEASARNGDAASLEQLAIEGAAPPGRLTSAALLGAPRAQLYLALENLHAQPAVARSWLEAAAKRDADAEAIYGACLLSNCPPAPDPAAARAALESAARRGAVFALGLLARDPLAEDARPWSPADSLVVPVPPAGLDTLGLSAADRYAWAALAGRLAEQGCFGLDLGVAAEALAARPRLERALSPADAAAGAEAAAALEADSGAGARRARGCE